MENKVIAKEYVDKNYIHKDVIREIKSKHYCAWDFREKVLELLKEKEETKDARKLDFETIQRLPRYKE